ncbi:MAG: YihA family ribosome biogenesis GTP-binding protein [Candidatus Delongbacteria bacterium]|nr:YihA family ribosome biogenesis GTP-binding protein [Candidatus Delongbacteria bacterium]
MINFEKTHYVLSAYHRNQLIQDNLPQFAFIGRSNVGKSSLINTLTNKKKLAMTSKTPGKTRLVNYFLCDERFYLVDLPGYGFAKTPADYQKQWKTLIEFYLLNTPTLMTTFLLWDISVFPQSNDLMMLDWYLEQKLYFQIVLTKIDRITQHQKSITLKTIRRTLGFPYPLLEFSAKTRLGLDNIRQVMASKVEE